MAVTALSVSGDAEVSAFIKEGTTGATLRKRFGVSPIPALDFSLTFGTGSGQANWLYYASRTVATVTADNLDLSGSLTDAFGNSITATKLKLLIVAIASPDGTKALRVGPQSVSNAATLNFSGSTAYITVTDWCAVVNEPVAGYTISAGSSDVLGIYNPSAGSVTYSILMAGV